MKTDQLIGMLASGAEALDPHPLRRRYTLALGSGLAATTVLMLTLLGVRPDVAAAARLAMFWMKLAFPAMMLFGALFMTIRLSRPGVRLGQAPLTIAAPVIAVWLVSAMVLLNAAPEDRHQLIFGNTWSSCPLTIAALSVPLFGALIWGIKGCAPTRPVFAGAAAGLLAGAGGALVYALHCPEMAAPFLGIWYVLGMGIPAMLGAAMGQWMLRW
jgi:hypothetical protein